MNYRRYLIPASLVAILVVLAALYGAYKKAPTAPAPVLQTYTSTSTGIAFTYPDTYVLSEKVLADRREIVLIDKAAASSTPANGEGPTSITLDIFKNARKLSPITWIKTSPASNYKLSPNGSIASSTIGTNQAAAYFWDGLYHGESFIFEHKGNILMFTVTSLAAQDQIRADFANMLLSLQLN